MTLPPALAPLAAYRQFITYRLVPLIDKPGKFDKLPCVWNTGDVTAKGSGGAHDPSIWCTADEAYAYAILADRGHGAGVGFVFTAADPYWVVDIDNCRAADGWNATALEVHAALPGAACEVSQSGKGLHLFGRGTVPEHRCKNIPLGLEFYHTGRFIALSSNGATGDIDTDLSVALPAFVEKYFQPYRSDNGEPAEWTSEPCDGWCGPDDDDTLLERAHKSASANAKFGDGIRFTDLYDRNAEKLAARWPGSAEGGYDASSADMSLAMHLSWWTGRNCERIERLMRQSELYREKYERHSYLTNTIMRAVALSQDVLADKPREPPPPPIEVPPPPTAPANEPPVTYSITPEQARDKQEHLAIQYWLGALRLMPTYDEFADRVLLNSEPLTDHAEREAWFLVRETSGVKYAKDLFGDTLRRMAWANRFHPLRQWLDRTQPTWDGTPRIDTWLSTYLNVADSPYTQAVGALFLTAAVRRARQPGAKFDEMLVLEGVQGIEKSSAIAALCPDPEWFCDTLHLGMTPKELLEVTLGKWLVEAPELSNLNNREVEHVKAMLSRRFDRARMAFERNTTERGRQWVGFGTTNSDKYLQDPTGNRRIWPVAVPSAVDLTGLAANRDQLWAEAARREASGASIRLPRELWDAAGAEQAQRVVLDAFEDVLAPYLAPFEANGGRIRVTTVWSLLNIPIEKRSGHTRKVGETMRNLGWHVTRNRVDGDRVRFYQRGYDDREIIPDTTNLHKLIYEPPTLAVISGGKL